MAIADLLAKLVEMKNQLVANLNSMGVAADESEKLNALVPKVLEIETGVDTSDATAVSEDIAVGKTAYANGEKLTGTLVQIAEFAEATNFTFKNSVKKITIPDSVTSIGNAAFSEYSILESITIPNSVTSIGSSAFYNCDSLKSITIPNGVTSIGDWAFRECSILESITIPNSVTSMGDYAIGYCKRLAHIYYTGTEEQWRAISKGTNWNANIGSEVSGGTVIHYNTETI